MKPTDRVVYLPDPLAYGVGVIERVQANGEIVVTFECEDGTPFELPFNAIDLELEAVFVTAADLEKV